MSETKLRGYENFHIVLWLLKDTCWLMEWRLEGLFMIMPTVAAAFHITWLGRQNTANLFHNLAVSSWICGNAVWMIGEFFFQRQLQAVCQSFFRYRRSVSCGVLFWRVAETKALAETKAVIYCSHTPALSLYISICGMSSFRQSLAWR